MLNIFRQGKSAGNFQKVFGGRLCAFLAFYFVISPLAFSLFAHAAKIHPGAGSTSAAFLKVGVGARAAGMAGAYTALAGDPYAMYWNPAGLALIPERALSFAHNDYFSGMGQEYVSYAVPAAPALLADNSVKSRVAGLSLNYFHAGRDLERRSWVSEGINDITAAEGRFGAYDLALSFGYARNYTRALKAGAALKLIRQSIDMDTAYGAAADLGVLYDFMWRGRRFTAGAAARNIGPGIRFNERSYSLPLTFGAGLAHRLCSGGPLLSLEVTKPVDNYPSLALGAEQPLGGRLFVRGGYSYRQYGNESGGLSGLALGLGFVSGRFSFDYAMLPFGDLGNTHRLSAALRFLAPEAVESRSAAGPAAAPVTLASPRALALTLEQKPLTLSRSGVTYLVRAAVNPGPDGAYGSEGLRSLSFATASRGQARAEVNIYEGELPPALLEKLPAAPGRVLAWQVDITSGGTFRGEVKVEFEVASSKPEFYFLSGETWAQAVVTPEECGEIFCRYSVAAPVREYYAVVVRNFQP